MTTTVSIDLGHLFHLPRLAAVLERQTRLDTDWRCAVVARRNPAHGTEHVRVADAECLAAPRFLAVDPVADADGYAMAWQARVYQRWRGGPVFTVARVLADHLRAPHQLTVELDHAAVARLVRGAHVRPDGLRSALRRLIAAGLLVHSPAGVEGWGGYCLTIAVPSTVDDTIARTGKGV